MAIGTGIGDQHDVALLCRWQQPVGPKLVSCFTDRTDDVGNHCRGFVHTREVDDLMMRAVESGPDQGIHARCNTDVVDFAFTLYLGHLRQQHPGFGHQEPTWLNPQGKARLFLLEGNEHLAK